MSGGRDFLTDYQAILDKLRSPLQLLHGIDAEIEALNVPAGITEEDMRYLFELLYSSLHFTGIGETLDQKKERYNRTRKYYRHLGVKLLSGRDEKFRNIPKQIYAQKVLEKEAREINQAMIAMFEKEDANAAKAFVNSVMNGGRRRKSTRRARKAKRTTRKH